LALLVLDLALVLNELVIVLVLRELVLVSVMVLALLVLDLVLVLRESWSWFRSWSWHCWFCTWLYLERAGLSLGLERSGHRGVFRIST